MRTVLLTLFVVLTSVTGCNRFLIRTQNVVDIPTDPTGQLAYKFKNATAKAGKVTVESKNAASVPHNIAIKGGPSGPIVSGGQTSKIAANLKPGNYEFYCAVPGHEQAGMKGQLSVK